MRDDSARWAAADAAPDRRLDAEGLALRRARPDRLLIASGPRAAALHLAQLQAAAGWPDIVEAGRYAVSMRRDRLLLVNPPPLPTGWLDGPGLAISDMTDGYETVDLSGPNALALLKTGTELSLAEPSASALRLWHGLGIILYRLQAPDSFRLHIAAAQAEGLWATLGALIALPPP